MPSNGPDFPLPDRCLKVVPVGPELVQLIQRSLVLFLADGIFLVEIALPLLLIICKLNLQFRLSQLRLEILIIDCEEHLAFLHATAFLKGNCHDASGSLGRQVNCLGGKDSTG